MYLQIAVMNKKEGKVLENSSINDTLGLIIDCSATRYIKRLALSSQSYEVEKNVAISRILQSHLQLA
jgi:hypothetical protein